MSPKDRKEFLADASSFANSMGGHLIYGMKEVGVLPTDLVALPGIDADMEMRRLEQMARTGVRPPMVGLQLQPITIKDGIAAIVMRIPQSWNSPHQVTFDQSFRFYARGTNGKYALEVDEWRSIFSLGASAAERLQQFRIERISKIVAEDAPVPLHAGAKLVVHILPLAAF